MKKAYLLILCIALGMLFPASAPAEHDALADILFPASKHVTPSQFSRLTEAEYRDILALIRFQPDACWDYVKTNLSQHLDLFRKFDFSGDGADDLVFSSYCMQPEMRNYFWVREGKGYQYAGFIEGNILKVIREKGSPRFSAVVSRGWGENGYVGSISLYTLQKGKAGMTFGIQKKIMEFGGLTVPAIRTDSLKIVIRKDKTPMRSGPEINNEYDPGKTATEGRLVNGNIIAELAKGSRGEAISEFQDTQGIVWKFIIMNKDVLPQSHRFYDDRDGYKAGWVEAGSIEVVR